MTSFLEIVDRTRALLQERGRVTLRALQREFSLDEGAVADLAEELVDLGAAVREGNTLVLREDAPPAPRPAAVAPAAEPAPAVTPTATPESGERRQLTVMFCDLVGSTELAQRLDPEELRRIVRAYREVCVEATKRFGGHVAQYLGDGVMVYFGWPQAHEDDAGRAIRAGLELQRVLGERPEGQRIAARVGIHTGLVVVDPKGVGDEALALGPTSNLAARIEGVAQPGTVVVSDATLALCRGVFVTKSLGEIELKGVGAPVLLHEVERGAGVRSAIAADATHPMVGRDRELGHLLDRWDDVQEGRGQVVLVSGDPGMGKSRLLRALRDKLADAPHLWLDMQCSPFTSGSAFQPLVDLFQTGLAGGAAKSPDEASQLLVRGLESMPGLPGEKVIPYLLPLLGLPPSERYPLPQTSAEEQRNRTLAALVQLQHTLAAQQAVVLVAEDLHWSDPSTLEYLGRLVEQAPTARWLLLLTFRPEFRAPWAQSHVSDVKLAPLSPRVTRELITNAAGARLPEPVLLALEARSDGVPLFAEELVSGVLTSGVITQKGERYELTGGMRDLAIPTTLQDSLMGRLDRLSASKHIAQQAATLGREFAYELIEAVTDLDAPSLRTSLGLLVAVEILHQRGTPPDAVYTFRHALLQDTAYESQLLSTRKALHGKIAAVLEERFPERVAAEPERMARHCAAAGNAEAAVGHYRRAAELAASRLANEEASEQYARALEALASLPESEARGQQEIAIRLAHGRTLAALRGYQAQEVLDTFARVEALCAALGEGPQQLPALIGLALYDIASGGTIQAAERAHAILPIAEPLGIAPLVVLAHYLIGASELLTGSALEAEARLARASEILDTVEFPPPATVYDLDLPAMFHATRAILKVNRGAPGEALVSMGRVRERLDAIDHAFSRAGALSNLATASYLARDLALARSTAEDVLAASEGRGFHSQEAIARILLGWARARQGETDAGARDVDQGIALVESSGSSAVSAVFYVAAADAHRSAGGGERAHALLDQALVIGEREGAIGSLGEAALARALLLLGAEHEPGAVEALLQQAADLTERAGALWTGLLVHTQLARLAPRTGRVREAHARLAAQYARLTDGFDRAPAREAKAALDELAALLASGSQAP